MIKTCAVSILVLLCDLLFAESDINAGDKFYEERGIGFDYDRLLVDSRNIDSSIFYYKKALQNSNQLEEQIIWRIIRSLYYKGTYASDQKSDRKKVYEEGILLAEKGAKKYQNSMKTLFWSAIIWGVWAEETGILAAARKGVADIIRNYCQKVAELDSTYQSGGAYRLLGRVHFKSPKIPVFLNWPSKEMSLQYLKRSLLIDSENLWNKQYLAETLYLLGDKSMAKKMMAEIINTNKIVYGVAEDAYVKRDARIKISEWK